MSEISNSEILKLKWLCVKSKGQPKLIIFTSGPRASQEWKSQCVCVNMYIIYMVYL